MVGKDLAVVQQSRAAAEAAWLAAGAAAKHRSGRNSGDENCGIMNVFPISVELHGLGETE